MVLVQKMTKKKKGTFSTVKDLAQSFIDRLTNLTEDSVRLSWCLIHINLTHWKRKLDCIADSTRKTYSSAQKRYRSFCARHHFTSSEHLLRQFATHLAEDGLQTSTIKCYLSGVRQLHLAEGVGDPGIGKMARLEQVLKGIKSEVAKKGQKPSPRLPITPELLLAIKETWEKEPVTRDRAMIWAAALLCFFGFLHLGGRYVSHI